MTIDEVRLGQRVRLSPHGMATFSRSTQTTKQRLGTVANYSGNEQSKKSRRMSPNCVRVRWDGGKQAESYHAAFLELVPVPGTEPRQMTLGPGLEDEAVPLI